MAQTNYQPLTCKKCGKQGLYHPGPTDDIGTWHKEDKFGNIQAFEKGFDCPHWYVCEATVQGSEHREGMMNDMTEFRKRQINAQDMSKSMQKQPLVQGQKTLPAEKLTPIDREIAAKINVIEMLIEDIKKLIAHKALDEYEQLNNSNNN